MFQYSRRQLLTAILRKINAASDHRDEHRRRDEPEYGNEKHRIDSLLKAVKAAENQVEKLEYWSDIHNIQNKEGNTRAMNEAEGWNHGWRGHRLSQSENSLSTPGTGDEVAATGMDSTRIGITKGKQPLQESRVAEPMDEEHNTFNDFVDDHVDQYDSLYAKMTSKFTAPDLNHSAAETQKKDDAEKENRPPKVQK